MNTQHDIKIEEIYIPSKHDKNTYLCEDFIIYPDGKEKFGGFVFGIIEIRATAVEESEKIIRTIVNTIKEKYYNQINSSPDPSKLNLETVFEYALQKANESLTELIQISHINFPIENLNYLIGVAKPSNSSKDIDIYFTQQGLINAYLLHKTKQNNYKLINIIDNTPRISDDGALKFFSSTLNGKIYFHDSIVISTEIFNNYIPPHKINKILASNDLPTAINYFKTLINNVKNNSYLTYAAIFIKMEERRDIIDVPISQKSMDNLISTKEKTEKFLTPTFALNIRDTIFNVVNSLLGLIKRHPKSLAGPQHSTKLKFGIIKYLINAIKIIFVSIFNFFKRIFNLFSDKEKLKESKSKIFTLHKINKTIIIIAIILVIVLVSSIFWIQHRKDIKIEAEKYAQKIEALQNTINDAQVNLIYKNETVSLNLIKQAEEDVKYLPQATTDQIANYTELMTQISNIKNKLLHIEKIIPQLIAETSINTEPIILAGLVKNGDQIITYGINNALFTIQNGQTSSPYYSNSGDFSNDANDERLLFLTKEKKLLEFTNNELKPIEISLPNNQQITSANLYGNRLYILDAQKQEIVKHQGNEISFGTGQSWITDKKDADLSQAIDMAIDGNIYILNKNGKIYKFFSGVLEDFTIGTIEPSITNASKIVTNAELNNLYILEGKRIIVLSKDGNFITQYSFETLQSPISDFTVTGADETITLISANKIYEAKIK